MLRPAARVLRASASSTSLRAIPRAAPQRRLLSTAPPAQKKSSWKGSAVRLGAAVGIIYWYNTSNVFAEEPAYVHPSPSAIERESGNLPTLDSIASSRRKKQPPEPQQLPAAASASNPTVAETANGPKDGEASLVGSPDQLEEEAGQQGAFNPETGEINWDCPCLGGMAHGPCGEEFKAAFSCFVYSKEDPKGVDCIEHFKTMQNCFRDHPDVYGSELDDDEDEEGLEVSQEGVGEKQTALREGESAVDVVGKSVPEEKQQGEKATPATSDQKTHEREIGAQADGVKTATEQLKKRELLESENAAPKV